MVLKRIAITLLAVTALSATMVAAQAPIPGCMPVKEFDRNIREMYGETVAFTGRLDNGLLLFVYINDTKRTFTFVAAPDDHPDWRCPLTIYGTGWSNDVPLENPT